MPYDKFILPLPPSFPSRPTSVQKQQSLPYSGTTQKKSYAESPNTTFDKNSIRVLAVDDSRMNRIMMVAFLRRSGYTSYAVAENGQAAFAMHVATPFDVILTDVDMPVQDGYEMTRLLKQREENAESLHPVIVFGISGNALSCDVELGTEAGMDESIAKPYKFSEIEDLLARHILQRQQEGLLPSQPTRPKAAS